jgi:polysaccharide pyruvyl transferase WcaK-like protein
MAYVEENLSDKGHAPKRIGLLDHCGGGNLGDDGSLQAVIQNIRRRWPAAAIFGLSMNPEDTRSRHAIQSYAIRARTWNFRSGTASTKVTFKEKVKSAAKKYPLAFSVLHAINTVAIDIPTVVLREVAFLARSFRLIRSFDLLIISGGGQLVESPKGQMAFLGGPWQFPYTIFKWAVLARLGRVKCIVLNVGAGPLVTPLGKYFVRSALFLAEYVSFRDEESRALARRIGFDGQSHVFPDCAYSLDVPVLHTNHPTGRGRPVVGLAPMAFGDPRLSPKHDPVLYDGYIRRLGMFGCWLLKNGYDVTLFCSDIGTDPPAVEDLRKILEADRDIPETGASASLLRVHQWSTEELLGNMASMDYAVVVRFHAAVMAHMMNIPLLAVNHHPKVRALMNDVGLSDYCLNVENCDLDRLTEKFESLVKSRDEIKSRMAEKSACFRRKLALQFDGLFPSETSHA